MGGAHREGVDALDELDRLVDVSEEGCGRGPARSGVRGGRAEREERAPEDRGAVPCAAGRTGEVGRVGRLHEEHDEAEDDGVEAPGGRHGLERPRHRVRNHALVEAAAEAAGPVEVLRAKVLVVLGVGLEEEHRRGGEGEEGRDDGPHLPIKGVRPAGGAGGWGGAAGSAVGRWSGAAAYPQAGRERARWGEG